MNALDDIWSETINDGEYVRITIEESLTSENDITIYSSEETTADGEDVEGTGGGGSGVGSGCASGYKLEDGKCVQIEGAERILGKLFDVKIIDFKSPVKLGEFFDFTYFILGLAEINNDVEVQFWIEKGGEIISSGLDTIYLGSFEEKTQTTKIFLPNNIESGIYTFVVQVDHEKYSARSERTIEISVGEGGIARITEIKGLRIYAVILLIILAIIILSLIVYLERKKIKAEIIKQEGWIKKHKVSTLAFTLFIVLGTLFYFLNLFDSLVLLVKIPFFYYTLRTIFALFILLIIIILIRKMNLFGRFKRWNAGRRIIKLKSKHKQIKLIKAKSKSLIKITRREKRQFKNAFFNFVDASIRLIKKIFEISFRLGKKAFENLKIFSRIIKKKLKLIFKESRDLEKTVVKLKKQKIIEPAEKTRRKLMIWSKIKSKLYSGKISRFWKAEKLPKHLISKETQKEIKQTFSFKSTTPGKFKKFGSKSLELIQKFIGKTLKDINNSIKSLKIFASKKRKEIALEGREVAGKTGRTIEEIYEEIFHLLRKIFGNKSYADIVQDFKKKLVRKRKFTRKHVKILKSLEENTRREFKQTKLYIHRNLDNLRNEAEVLIKKLVNYLRNLDEKEIEKIRKTVFIPKARSTRLINKVKRNLKNFPIVIHHYLRKMQISYLRGLHNIKKMFFKERREVINLIKELENRELRRMQDEEDKKVKKLLEQKKEANKKKIFKKKVETQSTKKIEDESTKDIIENIADKEKEEKL